MREYYLNILSTGSGHKLLYKVFRQMTNGSRDRTSLIELVQTFSVFFDSKIRTISTNLDSISKQGEGCVCTALESESGDCGVKFCKFQPATESTVRKLICGSSTKTCSLDPVFTQLMKQHTNVLTPPLTKIINASLAASTAPASMKKALATQVLKKTGLNKEELKNYRLVSTLSLVSKLHVRKGSGHPTLPLSSCPQDAGSDTVSVSRLQQCGDCTALHPQRHSGRTRHSTRSLPHSTRVDCGI